MVMTWCMFRFLEVFIHHFIYMELGEGVFIYIAYIIYIHIIVFICFSNMHIFSM